MLRLHLFGTPRLEREGQNVTPGRSKALALLAYLAVTGTAHERELLATLLEGVALCAEAVRGLWAAPPSQARDQALAEILHEQAWLLVNTGLLTEARLALLEGDYKAAAPPATLATPT